MVYVLDACALITFLNDETGSDIIEDLLKKAIDGQISIFMNIINLIEVHYANIRNLGQEQAAVILEKIYASPIQVITNFSSAVFQEASRLKAFYKCSLADAIGLACAIDVSGQFVTSDHHELEAIEEKESIPILWLPQKSKK